MQAVDLTHEDIHAYLARHQRKELLRFLTCGSVDDGKSTLIGRLLHDTKMIYEDQLAAVKRDSEKVGTTGAGEIDLAPADRRPEGRARAGHHHRRGVPLLLAPTAASSSSPTRPATSSTRATWPPAPRTCQLAIILIDARHGVQTQTRRHSFIVSLLGIRHVVVAINKMDLVGYSQEVFERIKDDYTGFVAKLEPAGHHVHPDVGPEGRQRRDPQRGDAVVLRPAAARSPRDGPHRQRPQPDRPAFPGAVRHSPQPRLPRLRRHGRVRHRPQGRRGHGAAVGQAEPGEVDRDLRRRVWTKPSPRRP